MSKIILVAETGSDVTPDLAQQYNIQIVPMHVSFDTDTYDDGAFSVEKIVDYYKETGKLPKTSGSTPDDFIKKFDEIHEKWPEAQILYLAYSAITTCSYQSAAIAAQNRDYVTLFDTKHVSVGQGEIVVSVAQALEQNPEMTMEEALEVATKQGGKARMCFVPDNLEFLRAGGRVSNVAFLGARILGIIPCIEVLGGKLLATKKYRGKMEKVAVQLVKEYTEKYNLDKKVLWLVHTIGLSDEVKARVEAAVTELGYESFRWTQAGGVITTHGGPGAFGLAGFSKND